MYSHFVAEMIARQKLEELRKEAEISRLLNQEKAGRQGRGGFFVKFFSWITRNPKTRPENRPQRSEPSPCVDHGALV